MNYNTIDWQPHFEQYEGRVSHFYLDGTANVTIGVGCLVADPAFLQVPMYKKTTSLMASAAEVRAEFDAVKAMEPKKLPSYYDKACQLYVTSAGIDVLFARRLAEIVKQFQAEIHVPADASDELFLAGVDMAFTCGAHGLRVNFPKFTSAYERSDWAACAAECHRVDVQPARDEWAKAVFLKYA